MSSHGSQWFSTADCKLDEFIASLDRKTDKKNYPHALQVVSNVPLYEGNGVDVNNASLRDEIVQALLDGPGIVVFKKAFSSEVIDKSNRVFNSLLDEQRNAGVSSGDHFAPPGANERLWRAQQKFAESSPDAYIDYYSNSAVALVSYGWLGPGYQVTSDLNVVNPGGSAQSAHRDYHLGFMSAEAASNYPRHTHLLSPALTLQGAVAHCDMPIESGPTLYLPYSQHYAPGYIASTLPAFREYFNDHFVQLPLEKGDAVFFNPALFHAAGHNTSSHIKRMANLLQVSSAFGRALGAMDRERMVNSIYPVLLEKRRQLSANELANVIAATAEGYAFPTNLDRDQPLDRLTPITQAELVERAVAQGMSPQELETDMAAQAERRRV